jgi:transmembrane 9 superfamily member 3
MVGELLPSDQEVAKQLLEQGNKDGKDDLSRLDKVADVTDLGDLVPYVYTTRVLKIKTNGDRIVQVDLTSDPLSLVKVQPNQSYEFSLHIQWESTNEEFHSRFDRYLDHDFLKHPIHWFSVFNSFMMV